MPLVLATSAQASDLWEQLEAIAHKTGNALCDVTHVTGADFRQFSTGHAGQWGCVFGWGDRNHQYTQLEFSKNADLHVEMALIPSKFTAFAGNGHFDIWGGNTAVGLKYQMGQYHWLLGASCESDFAVCESAHITLQGTF